jgi:hypothetical protein
MKISVNSAIKMIALTLILVMLAAMPQTCWGASDDGLETPKQIWERFNNKYSLPYNCTIGKDEIVVSDSKPSMKLRRVELHFYSQETFGKKWGHPCVVYMPADKSFYNSPERRGKVVIVGQRSWDGLATGPWRGSFLGNYGEPIAAETGYPTMICPVPGEYDNSEGREISISILRKLRKESNDIIDHGYFRLAVPYLRALDVMAEILDVKKSEIRAIIGGHSKRVSAYTAAAIDPQRIVGMVYMGNESAWSPTSKNRAIYPPQTRKWAKAKTLYIGGLNEDGYTMFNINKMQEAMHGAFTINMLPNYRHASQSEKHFMNWKMWTGVCFEYRPITKISDLSYAEKSADFEWGGRRYGAGGGTLFRCKIDTPNKIIQAKIWYVYCDDVPYWRDLMWYPEFMIPKGGGYWEGYVKGKLPDAWIVEVKDVGKGYPGYITSLPQDITGKETARRTSRGSRSRNWAPKQ